MNWTGGQRNKSITHLNHNHSSKILDLKKKTLLSSKQTCTSIGRSCHGDHSNGNIDESSSRAPVCMFSLSRNVDQYKQLQQKRQEKHPEPSNVHGHHTKKA